MSRMILPLLVLCLLFGCNHKNILPQSPDTQVVTTTGVISGRVFYGSTYNPIINVSITTTPATSSVITDSTGLFRIEDVSPGGYMINAGKAGYNREYEMVAVRSGQTRTVILTLTPAMAGNNPPTTPHSPSPAANAVKQPVMIKLIWTCFDSDQGDTLHYTVYLEDVNPPTVLGVGSISETWWEYDGLDSNRTYYWMVIAKDNHGAASIGPIWTFTTGTSTGSVPQPPMRLYPSDGDTGLPLNCWLGWGTSATATSYALQVSKIDDFSTCVYDQDGLGTHFPTPTNGFESSTTYYWRVNATNDNGTSGWSSVWKFKTMHVP